VEQSQFKDVTFEGRKGKREGTGSRKKGKKRGKKRKGEEEEDKR